MTELILGLLDTSHRISDPRVAEKARGLTIDWSRFKYSGPIVEARDLDVLLERAVAHGRRWCLVQPYGHVLNEIWRPEVGSSGEVLSRVTRWFEERRVTAADASGREDPPGTCLVIDLERWQALGRPPGADLQLTALPSDLLPSALHLRPEEAATAAELGRYLEEGIAEFDPEQPSAFGARALGFLELMQSLVGNLQRGVFVWNVEPYADVEEPPEGCAKPLSALYSVAAGLKPNRILETHGFDAATRVIYYDYSAAGLRFRRLLLDTWDGRDYPSFLRRLFKALPQGEVHYVLWQGATPDTLDWDQVARRWSEEIDAWGGAGALALHWAHYRRLPHELVHCNLLGDRGPLLDLLEDRPGSVIWWSNAFFSVFSNWFHTAGERREMYRSWLDELARKAPGIFLYGASSDNVSVNAVRAREYRDWFAREGGDELLPGKRSRLEILF